MKMFLRGRPVPMLIPEELVPTYSLDTRSELPSRRFKLDWVYPFTLISSSRYPHPHPTPPIRKGRKPFPGTAARGRVFVRKRDFSGICEMRDQEEPGVCREQREAD